MKAAVIVLPGSNCDYDAFHVLSEVLGVPTDLLWHEETQLDQYDLVVLPGGFSYGDYLRGGAIARFSPAVLALSDYVAARRGLVLGICNGFQTLTEAGLLPGALAHNVTRQFICKTVALKVENADSPFTNELEAGEHIELPIAHSQGRYVIDPEGLTALKRNRQILLTYAGENPNGSTDAIAGIMDRDGKVFGLMPHPERNSETILGSGDGLRLWKSLVHACQEIYA
jgi:phosphoribosylformylglycinamidine synthase